MAGRTRRTEALSRGRIVEAAVELLDTSGAGGLTFRALSERLATGPGAIYWHVANKDELLGAATDAVVGAALDVSPSGSPDDRIRAVALGLFDLIDDHPWVGLQLSGRSWEGAALRILESIGREIGALGVPRERWFTTASVLVQYILGAAAQNAANARNPASGTDRDAFLGRLATTWQELDPDEFGFTRAIAGQMRDHDDREQFLAGIDLALAGVTALHPGTERVTTAG